MFIKENFKKQGFTLVETLVAVSIFSISIIGLMSVLGKGISDTNFAKQKVTASYLAEEGIEYIRNMRDTYVLYDVDPTTGWNNFIAKMNSGSCANSSGCGFRDTLNGYSFSNLRDSDPLFFNCDDGGCLLNYDSSTGKYFYSQFAGGSSSGFSRKITFVPNQTKQEIQITSIVSWMKGGFPHSVVFSTNLLRWKE